jgi:hypothetical protein
MCVVTPLRCLPKPVPADQPIFSNCRWANDMGVVDDDDDVVVEDAAAGSAATPIAADGFLERARITSPMLNQRLVGNNDVCK